MKREELAKIFMMISNKKTRVVRANTIFTRYGWLPWNLLKLVISEPASTYQQTIPWPNAVLLFDQHCMGWPNIKASPSKRFTGFLRHPTHLFICNTLFTWNWICHIHCMVYQHLQNTQSETAIHILHRHSLLFKRFVINVMFRDHIFH